MQTNLHRRLGWRQLIHPRKLLHVGHMVFAGLFFAILGGRALVQERWPISAWREPLQIAEVFGYLWMIVVFWPGYDRDPEPKEAAVTLSAAVSIGVLAALRQHEWALIALGMVTAIFLWWLGKRKERFYILAISGWLLGGCSVVLLRWPGDQRFDMLCVVGGLSMALQGLLEVPYNLNRLALRGGSQ